MVFKKKKKKTRSQGVSKVFKGDKQSNLKNECNQLRGYVRQ